MKGIVLVLALLLGGCSAAQTAEIKSAATRLVDSAESLAAGWKIAAPVLASDTAAVISLKAVLQDRIEVHKQLVKDLQGLVQK